MLQNLLSTFLKKGLYAVVGLLIALLTFALTNFHPTDPVQAKLWETVFVFVITGIIAALKRLLTWDPKKVGR